MFFENFKLTGLAMAHIFILGGLGYYLVKKKILSIPGLEALSRLLIQVIFPALILAQMLRKFNFSLYRDWWVFPILSMAINVLGLAIGFVLMKAAGLKSHRMQFLSLVGFQNSGYLPLALVASIFTGQELSNFFIYIFLFLLGFDLVAWSLGIYMLTYEKKAKFRPRNIFSPPVIANIFSLIMVAIGLNKHVPESVFKPLEMVGNCTLPLAMIVVGGNVALAYLKKVDIKAISFFLLGKLFILPALGILVVLGLKLPYLIGFLVVMQLAMPSATSLSVIVRHYQKEDALISQGIFFSHLVGLLTIPLFLGLYLSLAMVK